MCTSNTWKNFSFPISGSYSRTQNGTFWFDSGVLFTNLKSNYLIRSIWWYILIVKFVTEYIDLIHFASMFSVFMNWEEMIHLALLHKINIKINVQTCLTSYFLKCEPNKMPVDVFLIPKTKWIGHKRIHFVKFRFK